MSTLPATARENLPTQHPQYFFFLLPVNQLRLPQTPQPRPGLRAGNMAHSRLHVSDIHTTVGREAEKGRFNHLQGSMQQISSIRCKQLLNISEAHGTTVYMVSVLMFVCFGPDTIVLCRFRKTFVIWAYTRTEHQTYLSALQIARTCQSYTFFHR